MKRVDLTGYTFGLLTVLGVSGKKHGDYCPENCIWIPVKDQSRNRRNTVRCGGVALSVLAVLYGVPYDLLYNRFRFLNWPIEEALGLVDHVYDEDRCKESLYYKNRRWKRGCKQ